MKTNQEVPVDIDLLSLLPFVCPISFSIKNFKPRTGVGLHGWTTFWKEIRSSLQEVGVTRAQKRRGQPYWHLCLLLVSFFCNDGPGVGNAFGSKFLISTHQFLKKCQTMPCCLNTVIQCCYCYRFIQHTNYNLRIGPLRRIGVLLKITGWPIILEIR